VISQPGQCTAATRLRSGLCLLAAVLATCPVYAGDWSQRAGQMNRKEISAADAARQNSHEDQEHRNKLSVRRVRPTQPDVDWNADPTAIPYMLYQVNKRTELPVFIKNEGLNVESDELFEHTVIYLTAHRTWSFNEKEITHLQMFLKRGGSMWLDDCYNRGSGFTDSVRPEVSRMIPGADLVMLSKDDPKVKDTFRMVYPTPWPGAADFENRPWQYFLLDGRPTVFLSPNDDGCSWEVSTPPSASNPIGEGIGHGGDNRQRETMYQWSTNFLLFVYTH
jgi:hypothetical protein